MELTTAIIVSLIAGFVVALIINLVMRSQLKSVAPNNRAANYIVPGSLHFSVKREFYLYAETHSTPKPKDNNNDN